MRRKAFLWRRARTLIKTVTKNCTIKIVSFHTFAESNFPSFDDCAVTDLLDFPVRTFFSIFILYIFPNLQPTTGSLFFFSFFFYCVRHASKISLNFRKLFYRHLFCSGRKNEENIKTASFIQWQIHSFIHRKLEKLQLWNPFELKVYACVSLTTTHENTFIETAMNTFRFPQYV